MAAGITGLAVKSVLVATDFSEASVAPLQHALSLARHYGSKICLAHVISSSPFSVAGPSASAATVELTRSGLARHAAEIASTEALDGVLHKLIVMRGSHVSKSLQSVIRQENVDLLVLGTHARRGLGKVMLGSTAEQMLRSPDCPALTIGPHSHLEPLVDSSHAARTFLFATDLTDASLGALKHAIDVANQFCAKLILLRVLPTVPMEPGVHWYTVSDVIQLRDNARIESECRLEWELEAQKKELLIEPEYRVEFGRLSESILGAAAQLKADAIILGLNPAMLGRGGSHISSATTYEVICRARCPVLTFPPPKQ